MGGSSAMEDEWEFASTNDAITLVLLGKLGDGKSATGNSILGRNAFDSKPCMTGVTSTCQMESTVLRDGRTVNIIDTPGLIDWSVGSKEIGKEIVNCVKLAKDGIHAVIMVFSIRSRFSEEEKITLERLQMFFGERIVDYMILVFTGGDDLDEEKTFIEYLSRAPKPVQTIIKMCKDRVVLFNNKTKDENEKDAQVQKFFFYVNQVTANNEGKPFSDEIFGKLEIGALKSHEEKEQIAALKEEIYKSYNDQLTRITEMVEQKLNKTTERLEKELAKEQAARLKAQKIAEDARLEFHEKICKLQMRLEKTQKETEVLKAQGRYTFNFEKIFHNFKDFS